MTICIVSHDPLIAEQVQRLVQIRDGKLAAETVRRRPGTTAGLKTDAAAGTDGRWDEHFEELIVLDSAGRLQIPKHYREELGFENRVEMEVADGGILIRPARNLDETSSQAEIQIEREIRAGNGAQGGLLSRIRGKSS